MLISLVIKISRYARNDKKMNYDTVSPSRGRNTGTVAFSSENAFHPPPPTPPPPGGGGGGGGGGRVIFIILCDGCRHESFIYIKAEI